MLAVGVLGSPAVAAAATNPSLYVVDGVRTSLDRAEVAATGAAIIETDHASVVVSASPSDLRRLQRLGHRVSAAPGRTSRQVPSGRPC